MDPVLRIYRILQAYSAEKLGDESYWEGEN